jgi:hypothetical protein
VRWRELLKDKGIDILIAAPLGTAATVAFSRGFHTDWIAAFMIGGCIFVSTIGLLILIRTPRVELDAARDLFFHVDRANEINRELFALGQAKHMLIELAGTTPTDVSAATHDAQFKQWRTMVRAYLQGTCREEIANEFESRSRLPDQALAARMFLHGLVNSLTRNDLRNPVDRPGRRRTDGEGQRYEVQL